MNQTNKWYSKDSYFNDYSFAMGVGALLYRSARGESD